MGHQPVMCMGRTSSSPASWEPYVKDLVFILLTLIVFAALALCVKGVEKLGSSDLSVGGATRR